MAVVDPIADRLSDEVRADGMASKPVMLEQLSLATSIGGIAQSLADVEVVAPAGELKPIKSPRGSFRDKIGER
jgi:hypothetical protein